MKTLEIRIKMAEFAIALLKEGITELSNGKILNAYSHISDDDEFSWDEMDNLFEEWDELVDMGNEILYE